MLPVRCWSFPAIYQSIPLLIHAPAYISKHSGLALDLIRQITAAAAYRKKIQYINKLTKKQVINNSKCRKNTFDVKYIPCLTVHICLYCIPMKNQCKFMHKYHVLLDHNYYALKAS